MALPENMLSVFSVKTQLVKKILYFSFLMVFYTHHTLGEGDCMVGSEVEQVVHPSTCRQATEKSYCLL